MVRFSKQHLFLGLATAGLVVGHGCSNVHLVPNQVASYSSTLAQVNFCTTAADQIKSRLKFIFIVDRSGSNQQRYDVNNGYAPLPGTDPTGTRRFDALLRFVQSFQTDPDIYWSMVNFSTHVLSGANYQNFTNNKTAFYNFVLNQKVNTASIDGGDTSYMDALNYAQSMISADIAAAAAAKPIISSNYVIFFVSDGAPWVLGTLQPSANIINVVDAIAAYQTTMPLLVDGVQFNTGYYATAPLDPGADVLLQGMAAAGSGNYLDFTSGEEIDFSRFTVPQRISKFSMKEFWVVNQNTVWEDNLLKIDSDGDGLSNQLEAQLGSNPNMRDSDENGVNDAVEYRSTGKPCNNSACTKVGSNPFTNCASLQLPVGSPTLYDDTDGDELNDCEEKLLGSSLQDFDSNQDYVPDGMAFRMGINMTGSSNLNLDPDFDGLTNYMELKYNTPLFVNNIDVPGLKMLQLNSTRISSDPTQDCYRMTINNIMAGTKTDQIKMYLLENTQALNQKRVLRISTINMIGGAISAQDSDFIHVGP